MAAPGRPAQPRGARRQARTPSTSRPVPSSSAGTTIARCTTRNAVGDPSGAERPVVAPDHAQEPRPHQPLERAGEQQEHGQRAGQQHRDQCGGTGHPPRGGLASPHHAPVPTPVRAARPRPAGRAAHQRAGLRRGPRRRSPPSAASARRPPHGRRRPGPRPAADQRQRRARRRPRHRPGPRRQGRRTAGTRPPRTLKTLTAVALLPRLDPAAKVRPAFDDVNVEGSKVGVVTTHVATRCTS